MDAFCPQKGFDNALDHMCDSFSFVGSGNVDWLQDGWSRSYPAGHRYRRISCPTFSGTKRIVAIWTLAGEGEGIWKGGGQQVQKDFAESYDIFSRKGLVMNHFTNKFTERSNR
jgi:hypothetical protein